MLLLFALTLSACGFNQTTVEGWPDVDLGATEVIEYKATNQRPLHLHVFAPANSEPTGAVLFFHGGGFRTTRIPQFAHQAQAVADAGFVGVVAEYRVTAEGTRRRDAVDDGSDALTFLNENAAQYGIDPDRIAMAGSSAGGALAVEAGRNSDAFVLFNPAVSSSDRDFVGSQPTIVFHSRQDQVVAFEFAEGFCDAVSNCDMVAFEEGDHGFFNDEPALTETTEAMIEFLEEEF